MATFCEGIVQDIERTECIGNSLTKINSNFLGLETAGCDLENKTEFIAGLNVINSSTIDLNWNPSTRTLSADAIKSPQSPVSPSIPSGALAKAWVTFTYRGVQIDPKKNASLLGVPRVLSSFNIAGVTRITNTALYVTFASHLPYRSYAVVLGQAASTADGVTVSARTYGQVPSEFPLAATNLVGSADMPYKSTAICKFESRGSTYLNEVYIAFF